jgi:hypothetical protein
MATLSGGAFITSINGKRCTAVPKAGASTKASANSETKTTTASTTDNVAQFTAVLGTATSSQDESSTSTSTTISTSLILITSTTSTSVASDPPPQQVQASAQVAPAALELTPAPEPSLATTSTLPTLTQIATSESQSQPSRAALPSAVIQTSQTDTVDTALATQTTGGTTADTTADTAAASLQQGTALPDVTSSPVLPESAAPLFTTIGTAPGPSNSAAAEATGSSSSANGAVSAFPVPSNNNAIQSTVAVAGGVIGGVLLVSMVAFFGWWWRRRTAKKRRSTLLTPLTMDNTFGPEEKGEYVINRGSIGPTPRAERFKAALGYNMRKINGSISRIVTRRGSRGSSAPSVNMNRGNSQFMEAANTANRPSSSAATGSGAEVTTKDRLMDWWTRLTADISFNWRLKNSKNPNSDDLFGSPRGMNEKTAGGNQPGTAPDFLTLLGMDDRELDREAQRRRMSPSRQNGGSASSSDRFLGGLNLNFGASDDPFSDANAVAHISAKPAPLVVSQNNNPFSDANAVVVPSAPKPGTYVAEMRRSRGQSVGTAAGGGPRQQQQQRPPSSTVGGYRESGASVESFATRRNKFRSDPFDLERPELLLGRSGGSVSSSAGATVGSSSRISGAVGTGDVRRPAGAHTRADSFTSKYSSGISMGEWSDPGPDVGPAAARGGWEGPEQRESPTQGWRTRLEKENAAKRERRTSGGSQGSVGKAM